MVAVHGEAPTFVQNRCYARLGWEPRERFDTGLERTVAWYRDNAWWWEPIRSGAYRDYYLRQYGLSLGR